MTTPHSKSQTVQQLEAASDAYLNPTSDREVDRQIVEMVAEFVIPRLTGDSILELGVGDRVWTGRLLSRFRQVTTVDGSAKLMQQLTEELRDHEFRNRWVGEVSLFEDYGAQQRYDIVLAAYVLDHLEDPLALLRTARHQWLAPEGRLVVVVAHALSIHRRLAVQMGLAGDPTELGPTNIKLAQRHCFRHDQLDQLVSQAGLRIVDKRGLLLKPLPNDLLVHCSADQLRGLFELGKALPIEYATILYYELQADQDGGD